MSTESQHKFSPGDTVERIDNSKRGTIEKLYATTREGTPDEERFYLVEMPGYGHEPNVCRESNLRTPEAADVNRIEAAPGDRDAEEMLGEFGITAGAADMEQREIERGEDPRRFEDSPELFEAANMSRADGLGGEKDEDALEIAAHDAVAATHNGFPTEDSDALDHLAGFVGSELSVDGEPVSPREALEWIAEAIMATGRKVNR